MRKFFFSLFLLIPLGVWAVDLPWRMTGDAGIDIIDANNDGSSWFIDGEMAGCYGSSANVSDDWMVLPEMEMSSEKGYIIDFAAMTRGSSQKVEIYVGQGDDPTTYTQVVLAPTEYNVAGFGTTPVTASFGVSESGTYRVALHVISEPNNGTFVVSSLTVKEGEKPVLPGKVTDLTAVPGANGAMEVTLSFKAPTVTTTGDPLSEISKIVVTRDGSVNVVKTFENPAPGASLSFLDQGLSEGTHTYTVTPYSASGAGYFEYVEVFVGVTVPSAPTNVIVSDNGDGTAVLSWTAPTTLNSGAPIEDPSVLTYNVYYVYSGNPSYMTTVSDTRVELSGLTITGVQSLLSFGVEAVIGENVGALVQSNAMIQGAPHELPYSESFSGGSLNRGPWEIGRVGTGRPGLNTENSYDNDDGCVYFTADARGDEASVKGPKITLMGSENPELSFAYKAISGSTNKLRVELEGPGVQLKEIGKYDIGTSSDWTEVKINLAEYKDLSYIRLKFTGEISDLTNYVYVDKIEISDELEYNLSAKLKTYGSMQSGRQSKIDVTVKNMGTKTSEGYTVKMFVDGTEIGSSEGFAIEKDAELVYTFNYTPEISASGDVTVKASVVFDKDENLSDNEATATVTIVKPIYPVATGLAVSGNQDKVELQWNAPDVNSRITESFETYEPFITTGIDEWTTVNADGNITYSLNTIVYPNNGGDFAYMVFKPSDAEGMEPSYPFMNVYDGKQYMASFAAYNPIAATQPQTDHWLISPELSGDAQTVSAYVCQLAPGYPETYNVLYSTTDKELSSFTEVLNGTASDNWSLIEAELPAGAKYFAIRNTSENGYVFGVDNVSFNPGYFRLESYNVYRDGVKVANVPAENASYVDTEVAIGDTHTYAVTAVYAQGESSLSESVSTEVTVIEQVNSDNVNVVPTASGVKVSGASGQTVSVYNVAGKCVFSCKADGTVNIPVQKGVYIVKIGNQAVKVMK